MDYKCVPKIKQTLEFLTHPYLWFSFFLSTLSTGNLPWLPVPVSEDLELLEPEKSPNEDAAGEQLWFKAFKFFYLCDENFQQML